MTQPQVLSNPQAVQQAMMQAVPEAMKVLTQPAWDAVLKMLRDNTQRQYRIDIETNSTVDVEATEDQKQMSEVLTAISQFIQGVSPLIVNGSMPFQVAQSMLLAIVRRYRMGAEIEDYIKAMQAPQPPDAGKQQAEQQKQQAEIQKMQAETQRANEQHQRDMARADQEQAHKKEIAAIELATAHEEARLKRDELNAKAQYNKLMADLKIREAQARVAEAEELSKIKVEQARAMPKKKEASSATS